MDAAAIRLALARRGWVRLPPLAGLEEWCAAVRPLAARLEGDPGLRRRWLRHGGSWFAGVSVLPNDAAGAVPGGPALPAPLLELLAALVRRPVRLDRGQLSVVHPGYPRRDGSESEAAFRYRRERAAAHVDGLLPSGPERRRVIGECHGFILGIALSAPHPAAAPLTVWEGSHELMRRSLGRAVAARPAADWRGADVTEAYHQARREAFARCPRVEIAARPGQAVLLHRLVLHGIGRWAAPEEIGEPRRVVYFRPELFDAAGWLTAP